MNKCKACQHRFNIGMILDRGLICIQCLQDIEGLSESERQSISDFIESSGYYFRREPAAKLARRLRQSLVAFFLAPLAIILLVELLIFLISFVSEFSFVALPDSLQGTLLDVTQILGYLTLLLVLFLLGIRWLGIINHALVALNYRRVVLHVLLSLFVPVYGVVQTLRLSRQLDRLDENAVTYGRLCIV